ncbi:MAG: TIGR04282 family arsenosugar biosynthesis glycosyltransferase [Bacteroidota bacterium]
MEYFSNRALLIFIKNAEPGKVKTRLAQTTGAEKALRIYRALLQHTREVAQSVDAYRYLFYSDRIEDPDDWPSTHFSKHVQRGPDLGKRIELAFSLALEQRNKAIIIGSDCASLRREHLETAFQQLDEHPFVVGPALDGGYYLLGMQQFSPSLFEDIPWSTDAVLATTLARIRDLEQSYFLLPELSDIDYEEDWEKYGWEI